MTSISPEWNYSWLGFFLKRQADKATYIVMQVKQIPFTLLKQQARSLFWMQLLCRLPSFSRPLCFSKLVGFSRPLGFKSPQGWTFYHLFRL